MHKCHNAEKVGIDVILQTTLFNDQSMDTLERTPVAISDALTIIISHIVYVND